LARNVCSSLRRRVAESRKRLRWRRATRGAQSSDHAAIGAIHGGVLQREGVTSVTGQGFIGASPVRTTVTRSRPDGDKVERDARWPHDGLVFVPDQMRQRSKKIVFTDEDFMMRE